MHQQTFATRRLVTIPLLAAVAFILQYLEFPLPLFPNSFLKLDFSTLPGLVGGLMFGPMAGVVIELLKNILHFLFKNTDGLLIGEFANFIAGSSFIVAAVWMRKSKAGFVAGLALGTVLMTVFMSAMNYFVLIPAYAALFHMPVDAMLKLFEMDSLWSLILYGIAPFNLIKGAAIGVVAYPIFRKLAPRLQLAA